MPTNYPVVFEGLLRPLLAGKKTISVDKLFASPDLGTVTKATKLKHLRAFISDNPKYVGTVEGVLPTDEVLLEAIEQRLGCKIAENNIVRANQECADIVRSAAAPVVATFVGESLSQHVSGGKISLPMADLVTFLLDDYASFSRGAGNGLVSTAGRMNEKLLVACLEEKGLSHGANFTKTGKNLQGDIVIHSQAGAKKNLHVEVKSHHARERLLRGLNDITGEKVGAGYFVDPAEFGPGRTQTLLQSQAAAIYMPDSTLKKVDQNALGMTTNAAVAFGSRFYRPLEQFATDMQAFSQTGTLPPY